MIFLIQDLELITLNVRVSSRVVCVRPSDMHFYLSDERIICKVVSFQ